MLYLKNLDYPVCNAMWDYLQSRRVPLCHLQKHTLVWNLSMICSHAYSAVGLSRLLSSQNTLISPLDINTFYLSVTYFLFPVLWLLGIPLLLQKQTQKARYHTFSWWISYLVGSHWPSFPGYRIINSHVSREGIFPCDSILNFTF